MSTTTRAQTGYENPLESVLKPDYELTGIDVDTSLGFLEPGRNLYVEGSGQILDNLGKVTGALRQAGYRIIHPQDLHTPEDEEIVMPYQEGEPDEQTTFPPHNMAEEYSQLEGVTPGGAQNIEQTRPEDPVVFDWRADSVDEELEEWKNSQEALLYKNQFNLFEGSPYAEPVINTADPDGVVAYGVTTEVCVDQAINGFMDRYPEADVFYVDDAIHRLFPDEEQAEEIKDSWEQRGATRVTADQIVRALGG